MCVFKLDSVYLRSVHVGPLYEDVHVQFDGAVYDKLSSCLKTRQKKIQKSNLHKYHHFDRAKDKLLKKQRLIKNISDARDNDIRY